MLLAVHVAAGGLAMVLGGVALSVKKGGTIHRRAGLLFVCAMLVMGVTASLLAFHKSPADPNVFAGFMTAYFVVTGVATVRRPSSWTVRVNPAALAVVSALALLYIVWGIKAFNTRRGFL